MSVRRNCNNASNAMDTLTLGGYGMGFAQYAKLVQGKAELKENASLRVAKRAQMPSAVITNVVLFAMHLTAVTNVGCTEAMEKSSCLWLKLYNPNYCF